MELIGLDRGCKDSIGGLKVVYLFKWQKYARGLITVNENVLTTFPATDIYPFYFNNNADFKNTMDEDAGGKFYNENIELKFAGGRNIEDEYYKLLNKDYRMIIKDRLGNYRLLGYQNGLVVSNFKTETGGAHSDFNGYTLGFEGKEEREALFINDLAGAGFTIIENDFILLENGVFMLTEDGQLIRK